VKKESPINDAENHWQGFFDSLPFKENVETHQNAEDAECTEVRLCFKGRVNLSIASVTKQSPPCQEIASLRSQ